MFSNRALAESLREFGYPVSVVAREDWEQRVKTVTARDQSSPLVPYLLLPRDVVSGLAAQGGFPRVDDARTRRLLEGSTTEFPVFAAGLPRAVRRSQRVETSMTQRPGVPRSE